MKGNAGKQLAEVLKKTAGKGTTAYDTTATVVRTEGDTLWVHIPGGIDETPIRKTINALPGDSVQIRVSGGRAWITGNKSAPPTDDRVANTAANMAAQVSEAVTIFKEVVADSFQAVRAKIGFLEVDTAKIHDLTADQLTASVGYIEDLTAEQITAGNISADHAVIEDLDSNYAHISNGIIDNAEIEYADVKDLDVNYAKVNAANIDSAAIREAWVNNILVQSGLIAHAGTVFELDAIQVNASKIKAGTLDVERLIVTVDGEKYMVHVDPSTGNPSYQKVDANVLEDLTITADKIVAGAITAEKITTENIVGTSGWINLHLGRFFYGNGSTWANTTQGIMWDGTDLKIKGNVSITAGNVYTKTESDAALSGKVGNNEVITKINASSEGVQIAASKVNIEGATIFSSGRLSQTSLNNAYDSKGAASNAESNAKNYADSLEAKSRPFIKGTQTAATGTWTGVCSELTELTEGQEILYFLPYAGSGNATLNLTLGNGSTTGAINCYYQNASRLTTHFGAGMTIPLVYHENFNIGGTNYTGWWTLSQYNSNNYDRKIINNAVKVAENIVQYCIAGRSGVGHKKLVSGLAIDLSYPICYLNQANISGQSYAVASGGTTTNFYTAIPSVSLQNTKASWTGTQYAMCYIKGTLSGNTFTVHSDIFTTTVPTSDDGFAYIPIGMLYSTYQVHFACDNSIYGYRNGSFGPLASREASAAQATANAAKSTADAAAPKTAAVAEEQRIYYRSNSTTAPTAPTTWVTSTATANSTWSTKRMQYDSTYKYLYTCIQKKTVSGTITNTTVLLDDTTTVIDGGNIITGTVTANKLNASDINASKKLTVGAMTDDAANTILNSKVADSMNGYTINWDNNYGGSAAGGEAKTHKYDPLTNQITLNTAGWVMWNGTKRTVPSQEYNPNTMVPYNIPVYLVLRLTSATATTGTIYPVWYANSKWNYLTLGANAATTDNTVGDWTWVEATDIVLGSCVEPGSEAQFTDCKIYDPPWTCKQVTSNTVTAQSAQTTANAAKTTADAAAPKTSAVAEEQLIYISKASGTSSVAANTTWVTATSDSQNTWTTKRPTYSSSYPVLFIAKQKKTVSGTVTCTTPLKDDTTTIIDGGHITTGTIDASKATITNINASNISTGTLSADRIAGESLVIGKLNTDTQTKITNGNTAYNRATAYRGVCSTAAATAAKVVTCANFPALAQGITITVYNTTANTVDGAITLNVNSTGAKTVHVSGYVTGGANRLYWEAGTSLTFVYDGTYWRLEQDVKSTARFAHVGQSSNTTNVTDKPWYKVGSLVANGANTDYFITFHVEYYPDNQRNGKLRVRVRTDGNIKISPSSCSINWIALTDQMSQHLDDFVLAYKADTASSTVELWAKVNQNWGSYNFKVEDESTRTTANTASWRLYNTTSDGGSASITSGYTQIKSVSTLAYITYVDATNGIRVHNAGDATDYIQVNSSGISFYRNSVLRSQWQDNWLLLGDSSATRVTISTTTDPYIYMNANGIQAFRADKNGVTIGNPSKEHVYITESALSMYDGGNVRRLYLDSSSGVIVGRSDKGHTTVNDNGLLIYDSANTKAAETTTNGLVLYKGGSKRAAVTANGLDIFGSDGSTSIASFGTTARIGKTTAPHVDIAASTISMSDGSKTVYEVKNLPSGTVKLTRIYNIDLVSKSSGTGPDGDELDNASFDETINLGRAVSSWQSIVIKYTVTSASGTKTSRTRTFTSLPISQTYSGECFIWFQADLTPPNYWFGFEVDGFTAGKVVTLESLVITYTTSQSAIESYIGAYVDSTQSGPFRVGNGTGTSAKSNAMLVDWSGNGVFANNIIARANSDSSGGVNLSKLDQYDGFYYQSGKNFVYIMVNQVGFLVMLYVELRKTTSTAAGADFFKLDVSKTPIPRPAYGLACGCGYYGKTPIALNLTDAFVDDAEEDGEWEMAFVARNASPSALTMGSSSMFRGSLTYLAEEWGGNLY